MVLDFEFQAAEGREVYTDTDWAGYTRTCKSASGGCLMLGRHLIKAWVRPNTTGLCGAPALSSASRPCTRTLV